MTKSSLEAYLYDAWNKTDHANELLKDARVQAASDELSRTIETMRLATEAAESAAVLARWAYEAALEELLNAEPS